MANLYQIQEEIKNKYTYIDTLKNKITQIGYDRFYKTFGIYGENTTDEENQTIVADFLQKNVIIELENFERTKDIASMEYNDFKYKNPYDIVTGKLYEIITVGYDGKIGFSTVEFDNKNNNIFYISSNRFKNFKYDNIKSIQILDDDGNVVDTKYRNDFYKFLNVIEESAFKSIEDTKSAIKELLTNFTDESVEETFNIKLCKTPIRLRFSKTYSYFEQMNDDYIAYPADFDLVIDENGNSNTNTNTNSINDIYELTCKCIGMLDGMIAFKTESKLLILAFDEIIKIDTI